MKVEDLSSCRCPCLSEVWTKLMKIEREKNRNMDSCISVSVCGYAVGRDEINSPCVGPVVHGTAPEFYDAIPASEDEWDGHQKL